ncbi:MAG: hypothetical protein QM803_09455 [Rhodocyclaceae bacterium]
MSSFDGHLSFRRQRHKRDIEGQKAPNGLGGWVYRGRKNLGAVHGLLGHTKLESTVRYLDIEVDDALELSEQTEI